MQKSTAIKKPHIKPCASQHGVGLIEVLVAIVILAVGLLGVAGMTAASIQHNQTARMRGTGVLLVNDLAERARINITGFDNDGYKKEDKYSFTSTLTAPSGCTKTKPCDASNLAKYDMNQWLQNVYNRLPGGSAYITTSKTCGASTAGSAGAAGSAGTADGVRCMDVTLIWTEPSDLEGNLTQTCPKAALPTTGDTNGIRCMNFRVTL